MENRPPRLSIVVPCGGNLPQLRECLAGLAPLPEWADAIVVADGAITGCRELGAEFGIRVLEIVGPRGPAVARNRGATESTGDVIVFIDADVVAAPGTLARIRDLLHRRPEIAAVFGTYDEQPRDPRFMSQYRNLSHSYFHQASRSEAQTFWAGLGAIRREPLAAVGGFDERFRRPSVEDIELGYRLTGLGYRILLDPSIRGCHLKRWTLRSSVVSDLRDRGIPWTQLLLKFASTHNDLNLRTTQRLTVLLVYLLLPLLALAAIAPVSLVAVAFVLIGLAGLNWRYYHFFVRRRGLWFLCRVFPLHILHHYCNGLSVVLGSAIFLASRQFGATIPGAVPPGRWHPDDADGPMVK